MASADSTLRVAKELLDIDKFAREFTNYDIEPKMANLVFELFKEMRDKLDDIKIAKGGDIDEDLIQYADDDDSYRVAFGGVAIY